MPRDKRFGFRIGSASARVHEFLKRHPRARPTEISLALSIKPSTVAMAISRLVQMKLHEKPPPQPREVKPKKSSPSPTESLRAARADFGVAATVGPSLLSTSAPEIHPTGTQFVVVNGAIRAGVGTMQTFAIAGPEIRAPQYPGNHVSHAPMSPWSGFGCPGPKRG